MMLNVKALGIASGLLWGACILVIGLANLAWPGYGLAFLDLAASIYPGYEVGGFGSVIWGTLYGLVDGAIAGIIVAWLYNKFAGSSV